jgi:hypothetical protein
LVYTAWDIRRLADDVWKEAKGDGERLDARIQPPVEADFMRRLIEMQLEENKKVTGGHLWNPPQCTESAEDGIPLPPFKWDEARRTRIRNELDAYFAHLYGLTRDELRYILDPKDVYGPDFPGETFRVLKEREEKLYGEYRTRRLVLEAFDTLAESPRFRDEMPNRISALQERGKAV